jgi:predicted lipoprotein with Yx(FWY)xxD motif
MRPGWSRAIAAGAAGLLILAAGLAFSLRTHLPLRPRDEPLAPLATPPGITLQVAVKSGRDPFGAPPTIVFADAAGRTLYTHEDGPGGAGCDAACARSWRAAQAPPSAGPAGAWDITAAEGREWRYRQRLVYRFAGDLHPGDIKGDGADGVWHAAVFDPAAEAPLPLGIGLRDLPNAGGAALVDDRKMTLYAASSQAVGETSRWKPFRAPDMAASSGDFTVIARHDGIRQWAFRGQPLYRYVGDVRPDDANGAGLDPGVAVALWLRYFMPAEIVVRHAPGLGDILARRDGFALYARDRFIDADGHDFRTDHGAPAVGRALGTAACDVECTKAWHPMAAPPAAISSGYWDVLVREDGTRQWAYKGYALYTFAGDARPGEVNGNESYALMPLGQSDSLSLAVPIGGGGGPPRPGAGIGALFWRVAIP